MQRTKPLKNNSDRDWIAKRVRKKELLSVWPDGRKKDKEQRACQFNKEERRQYAVDCENGIFTQNGMSFDTRKMYSHFKSDIASFTLLRI